MTWEQILAQAGIMASIIGVAIVFAAYFNGKHIKKAISEVIGKMDEGFRMMDERAEKRHQEVIELLDRRHKEVIELLKKGFGDLSRDIRELKK